MSEHHLPSRRRLLLGAAALPLLATTGCALVPFEALPPLARIWRTTSSAASELAV